MFKVLTICVIFGLLEAAKVQKPRICSFPFVYKGQTYDDCIKLDSGAYWCSVEKVYNGTFSYCKVDASDEIGDEHFLELIKQAEEHSARLNQLQSNEGSQLELCSSCIQQLKKISESIVEQSSIFMDQNKRLQGLKAQHSDLAVTVDKLNKYYQQRRCRQTDVAGEYLGRVSVTQSGYKCQAWASQNPQEHPYTDDGQYAENSIENAKNYCRNPSLDVKGPWCYTTNRNKRFEFCHLPKCNVDCKVDAKEKADLPMCDQYASTNCMNDSIFFNNKCYKAFKSPTDYASAEKICQTYNGHLTSIHSTSENNFIVQTVYQGSDSFYVGLTDQVKEGSLVWEDGSANDYQRFYSGEPNGGTGENCVELGRYPGMREAWNDIPCSERRGFVCQMSLNK